MTYHYNVYYSVNNLAMATINGMRIVAQIIRKFSEILKIQRFLIVQNTKKAIYLFLLLPLVA
jgi:hypothetical protein